MLTNISGQIIKGGVAQWLIPPTQLASAWSVQNLSTTEALWIREDGENASDLEGSIKIPPGALYETPSFYIDIQQYDPKPVSIFSKHSGHAFTARRY